VVEAHRAALPPLGWQVLSCPGCGKWCRTPGDLANHRRCCPRPAPVAAAVAAGATAPAAAAETAAPAVNAATTRATPAVQYLPGTAEGLRRFAEAHPGGQPGAAAASWFAAHPDFSGTEVFHLRLRTRRWGLPKSVVDLFLPVLTEALRYADCCGRAPHAYGAAAAVLFMPVLLWTPLRGRKGISVREQVRRRIAMWRRGDIDQLLREAQLSCSVSSPRVAGDGDPYQQATQEAFQHIKLCQFARGRQALVSWDTAKADPARALTALRQKHPPPSDIPEEAAVPSVDLSPVRRRIKDWLFSPDPGDEEGESLGIKALRRVIFKAPKLSCGWLEVRAAGTVPEGGQRGRGARHPR